MINPFGRWGCRQDLPRTGHAVRSRDVAKEFCSALLLAIWLCHPHSTVWSLELPPQLTKPNLRHFRCGQHCLHFTWAQKNPSPLLDLWIQSHNTSSLNGYAQSTALYSLLPFRPAKPKNDSLIMVFLFSHGPLLSSKHWCKDFLCALLVQPLVFGSYMPSVLGQSFPCCIKF